MSWNLYKKNEGPFKSSFLGLSIEIHQKEFCINLIDQRDAFPFYTNRMVYLDSNMPFKILKFYVLPRQEETWLIWQYMLIFC